MTPAERMKARTKLLLDKSLKQVFSSSFSLVQVTSLKNLLEICYLESLFGAVAAG